MTDLQIGMAHRAAAAQAKPHWAFCPACERKLDRAVALENGRQSVGIGNLSPETAQANRLRAEAWAHESRCFDLAYWEAERIRNADWDRLVDAGTHVRVWDPVEREEMLVTVEHWEAEYRYE